MRFDVHRAWLTGFIVVMSISIGGAARATPLDDATQTRVQIQAGDVVLGATLYRPAGASGVLPAIVTAHGSAPSTRDGVGFYTDRALGLGFAVLSFDKRGTGESTGTYEAFNVADSPRVFHDLAMDVVWSVRWIAQQDNIDPSRIGLFGGSQAGWIMPLAASLLTEDDDPAIRFMIIGEGVAVSTGEENAHEDEIMSLIAGQRASGQLGPDEAATPQIIAAGDVALAAYDGPLGFDPQEILANIEVPSLWLFGLRDQVIPVLPSITRLGEHLAAGKTNNHIHVFPFGDHNFRNAITGERYDVAGVSRDWLADIGVLDAD
jgi:dienelactone hydrolase